MAVFARRTAITAVATAPLAAAANAPGSDAVKPAATASDDKKTSTPQPWATAVATVVFLAALLMTATLLFGTDKFGPDYEPAEGIGAFALFYIVAQAAERLVEMVMPYLDRRPDGKNAKVAERNRKVVAAINTAAGHSEAPAGSDPAEQAADAQAEVDQIRANRTALVFASTAAMGMLLCGYLEADFLSTVGVHWEGRDHPNFIDELVLIAVTGLLVGGGSKALHDTISGISKSSEKKDNPPETGGAA